VAQVSEVALERIDKKIDHLTELVQAWPATCAEHRLKLTERIANGKVALGIPQTVSPGKQNGRSIRLGGYNVKMQTVVGAVVLAGMMLMGALLVIGWIVFRLSPDLARLVE
jgi:hypothetical protein